MTVQLVERPDGSIEFWVQVQPRAARAGVSGVRDGALVLRVTAPPVDGAANQALRHLLADLLAVPASQITVVHGVRSRRKLIRVRGLSAVALRARLGQLAAGN
jgi:uncharacterized protein (TIGR00251 family)